MNIAKTAKTTETLPIIANDDVVANNETANEQLELLKEQVAELVVNNTIDVPRLQSFQSSLNQDPPAELILVNKFANNTRYLPISFLEMLMDQVFLGGWEVVDFKYEIMINELVGTLTLRYYHPIFNSWLQRVGAAAVQIQTKSGTNPYDINNKIPNTFVKQVAQLKAECFRNAVKSLGKIFGRDLNREETAVFNDAYDGEDITIKLTKQIREVVEKTKASINSNSL